MQTILLFAGASLTGTAIICLVFMIDALRREIEKLYANDELLADEIKRLRRMK